MAEQLNKSVRAYVDDANICKRYMRVKEIAEWLGKTEKEVLELASEAETICRLPVITLICCKKLEDYMEQFREQPIPMKNPLWTKETGRE